MKNLPVGVLLMLLQRRTYRPEVYRGPEACFCWLCRRLVFDRGEGNFGAKDNPSQTPIFPAGSMYVGQRKTIYWTEYSTVLLNS